MKRKCGGETTVFGVRCQMSVTTFILGSSNGGDFGGIRGVIYRGSGFRLSVGWKREKEWRYRLVRGSEEEGQDVRGQESGDGKDKDFPFRLG